MAEKSVWVSTVSFAVTDNTPGEKRKEKQCEFVELEDLEQKRKQKREEKIPRRIIHFSSGETMEEYSTGEEDDSERHGEKEDLLSPEDVARLPWRPYVSFHMWRAATSTVSACDYVGERMASLFGITMAKYQYAIDQHNRKKKQDEVEDVQVSEEAESHFEEGKGEEPNPGPSETN